jgi:ABC-type multidrug transport system fused ATPase/permease subunit
MSLVFSSFSRYRDVVGEMLSSVGSDRLRVLWIFPLVAISSALASLAPYFAKIETDQLVGKHSEFYGLVTGSPFSIFALILLIIFLVNLAQYVFESFESVYRRFVFDRVESRFSMALVERLRYLEPGKLANIRVRSLVMDAVGGGYTGLVTKLFADTLAKILGKVVAFVGLFATFALVDLRLGLVLAAAVGCDYALSRIRAYINKKNEIRQSYSQISERSETIRWRMSQDLDRLISNHALPFILGVLGTHQKFSLDMAREQSRGEFSVGTLQFVSSEISELVMKIIVGYGVFAGTGSVGTMVMTVMAMGRLSGELMQLSWMGREIRDTVDKLEKLRIFYDFTRGDEARADTLSDLRHIECRNLKFRYPPLPSVMIERLDFEERTLRRELTHGYFWRRKEVEKDLFDIDRIRAEARIEHPFVLNGVNLRVERGETVAIVGSNGAGKTTLVETLMGTFDGYEGNILYDGHESRNLCYDAIADQFSVIDQEPYLLE